MTVDKMTVGEMSVDKMTAGEMPVDKMTCRLFLIFLLTRFLSNWEKKVICFVSTKIMGFENQLTFLFELKNRTCGDNNLFPPSNNSFLRIRESKFSLLFKIAPILLWVHVLYKNAGIFKTSCAHLTLILMRGVS